ncbi:hypothetical protein [Sneathiella glossodoripedis]|uniref:hypothetical protein n=1 Tax=Sneathiella glossodoripedis TaxID=418853 RepID=UPI00046F3A62|nr:hypothetical protein [Sneathiella glossodoripedis]
MTAMNSLTIDSKKVDRLLEEANALAEYVYRHGNILQEDKTQEDKTDVYRTFLNDLKDLECTKSAESWVNLQASYAKLSAITYAKNFVNGHTILETKKATNQILMKDNIPRTRPVVIGFALFILAILIEISKVWVLGDPDQEAGNGSEDSAILGLAKPALIFLIAATWGGIGSCIYLMKRISDKMFMEAYDSAKVRGDITRIFLGSMLGVCVVLLFFNVPDEPTPFGEIKFGQAIAAFIAGLGIKPVYAAFETLSEELASRLGKRRTATEVQPAR